ncbi:hypothetical protein MUK42_31028 [Musa troglodytarum]|uniref:Uncharacterized protein n=1 Tax=Musa troglodytarum TaxID=320322 RepID=A0A9E7JZG1_9LILI|nr:hypothetical protein MUK42_31028 [Musa troglodytarum]
MQWSMDCPRDKDHFHHRRNWHLCGAELECTAICPNHKSESEGSRQTTFECPKNMRGRPLQPLTSPHAQLLITCGACDSESMVAPIH